MQWFTFTFTPTTAVLFTCVSKQHEISKLSYSTVSRWVAGKTRSCVKALLSKWVSLSSAHLSENYYLARSDFKDRMGNRPTSIDRYLVICFFLYSSIPSFLLSLFRIFIHWFFLPYLLVIYFLLTSFLIPPSLIHLFHLNSRCEK